MTKDEHVQHWRKSAAETWESAVYLASGRHYALSLFAMHFSYWKINEAIWIKESVPDIPPFTHDLQKLSDEIGLDIEAENFQ